MNKEEKNDRQWEDYIEDIADAIASIEEFIIDMAGTRDKMIHHYFGVDLKVVWKTITEDIPSLKPLIRKMLNDIDKYRQQETSKDREV